MAFLGPSSDNARVGGREPSKSSQAERSRGNELRLAVVAIGFSGLCFVLWRAIGPSAGTSRSGDPTAGVGGEETSATSASSPAPPISEADRKPDVQSTPAAPPQSIGPEPAPVVRLHGQVLDARDRERLPVACQLRIADEEWEERSSQVACGSDYEFADLHPGGWDLVLEAAGFRTLRTRVRLEPDEKEKEVDLLVEPAFLVRVRLEASLGDDIHLFPVLDKLLVVGLQEDLVQMASSPTERILARGFPRSVRLFIVATMEEPGRFLETEARQAPGIGRFIARDTRISPPESEVNLRMLSSLGYARSPSLQGSTMARLVPPPLSDGSSLADLPPEYCGVLELSEPPPATASLVVHGFVIRSAPIAPGGTEVSFRLTRDDLEKLPGRIHFTLVDAETSAPSKSTHVEIEDSEKGDVFPKWDADGSITIESLLPGPTTLTILSPDRESISERITVQPGTVTELGTYRLESCSKILAKVLDEDGDPRQVSFNAFPQERFQATRRTLADRYFRSNAKGELKIDSLGHGPYVIVSHDDAWISAPVLVDTSFRQKAAVEIRVSKGTSVALRPRADPPPNGRLEIRTKSGLVVEERRCRSRDTMHFRLPPGSYSAELYDGETWLWSESLTVGGEPVREYLPR